MAEHRLRLERVALPEVPWSELDRRPDRTVFQTLPWLDFLNESQQVDPVVARVVLGGEQVGWFTGALLRRAAIKILGSPMRGWTTSYMGFNLDDALPAGMLLGALRRFAFSDLGCVHLEVMDRSLPSTIEAPRGFYVGQLSGYERRIDTDEEHLLGGMTKNGRRDVRRALRNGVVVEEVDPTIDSDFASEYYEQVTESFAKRSLAPTYPLERVEAMIRHLHPSGNLVLLRSRLPDGKLAATGVFPGLAGAGAVFWMGASHREHQALLPNEALMWHALRTWRDRGAVTFDFGGGGRYKSKYGGQGISVPWFRCSRFAILEKGRGVAQRTVRLAQKRAFAPEGHDRKAAP